ncbi:MAG: hypothetical protein ABSB70_10630 [Candidatus Velthaea sp.]
MLAVVENDQQILVLEVRDKGVEHRALQRFLDLEDSNQDIRHR